MKTYSNRIYYLLSLLFLISSLESLHAQNVYLEAKAPYEITIGDEFYLTYSLHEAEGSDFKMSSSIKGFDIKSGPQKNTSTSFSSKNGEDTSTDIESYTYTLLPKQVGVFELPVAQIESNGIVYTSKPISIRVLSYDEAEAKGITFEADVLPDALIATGQKFVLRYILTGAKGKNFKGPELIRNFEIDYGPAISSSTSTSVINGVRDYSSSQIYSYTIHSNYPSIYTLPVASVEVNGKTYTSNAVSVRIVLPENLYKDDFDVISPEEVEMKAVFAKANSTFSLYIIILVVFLVVGVVCLVIGISKKKKSFKISGIIIIIAAISYIVFFLVMQSFINIMESQIQY